MADDERDRRHEARREHIRGLKQGLLHLIPAAKRQAGLAIVNALELTIRDDEGEEAYDSGYHHGHQRGRVETRQELGRLADPLPPQVMPDGEPALIDWTNQKRTIH